jgi:transcriptional regulator of arginine metabolism
MVLFASSCKLVHNRNMTDARSKRQRALADLLRRTRLSRQDELVAALRTLGHEVTQATVSRDLDQLGAVKIRGGGETRYALPDDLSPSSTPETRLRALFGEWVRAVVPAASLVVLKTPPGSAHLVGVALDSADLSGVAGTICGDDTLFVATSSPAAAEALAQEWQGWLGT